MPHIVCPRCEETWGLSKATWNIQHILLINKLKNQTFHLVCNECKKNEKERKANDA